MVFFNRFILWILPIFPKKLIWLFSKKYIAGISIDDALTCSKDLNSKGCKVTIDILGEAITKLDEATEYKKKYLEVIERAEAEKIDGNYSLKPTMFGLGIDKDVCYQNIKEIISKASFYNNFVRIDMEDSPYTDLEIDLYKKLHEEFPCNVGLVFQSYLKRTHQDLKDMIEYSTHNQPVNFRICKGIYNEAQKISFKKYEEINEHFVADIELAIKNKIYVGIATHDKNVVNPAYEIIAKNNCKKEDFEFQMLLGITPGLRQKIMRKGYTMRIYVPFGKDWFKYSYRRFKENPKMVSHILKALFVKS